ncbi:phage tail protein [Escherichia coli]|nr:phage tail protein [Escherichia coli]
MSSNFERSQLTKIMISSAPVTAETLDSASYLGLSCTIKEVQFTAGQKQDIDVTTLYSGKRKLTAVCSHQTRIGNLDAHLI